MDLDDYDADLLKKHIPLFGESISNYSMSLYSLLENIITIEGGGMSGIHFRHSLVDIKELLEEEGFVYKFVKDIVVEFENRLYEEYAKEINEE